MRVIEAVLLLFASSCAHPLVSLMPEPAKPEPERAPAVEVEAEVDGPAACIPDPWSHAAWRLVEDHGARLELDGERPTIAELDAPGPWCTAVTSLPDLDGDGVEEVEVNEGCSYGSYGSLHFLYLSNHGCTRFAGELVAGELWRGEGGRGGVRDLEAHWSNGCAGNDFEWTRYAFTGSVFEAVETATCELCEDGPGADAAVNQHPYCQRGL